jgi:hypothetical protein
MCVDGRGRQHIDYKRISGHCRKSLDKRKGQLELLIQQIRVIPGCKTKKIYLAFTFLATIQVFNPRMINSPGYLTFICGEVLRNFRIISWTFGRAKVTMIAPLFNIEEKHFKTFLKNLHLEITEI